MKAAFSLCRSPLPFYGVAPECNSITENNMKGTLISIIMIIMCSLVVCASFMSKTIRNAPITVLTETMRLLHSYLANFVKLSSIHTWEMLKVKFTADKESPWWFLRARQHEIAVRLTSDCGWKFKITSEDERRKSFYGGGANATFGSLCSHTFVGIFHRLRSIPSSAMKIAEPASVYRSTMMNRKQWVNHFRLHVRNFAYSHTTDFSPTLNPLFVNRLRPENCLSTKSPARWVYSCSIIGLGQSGWSGPGWLVAAVAM